MIVKRSNSRFNSFFGGVYSFVGDSVFTFGGVVGSILFFCSGEGLGNGSRFMLLYGVEIFNICFDVIFGLILII